MFWRWIKKHWQQSFQRELAWTFSLLSTVIVMSTGYTLLIYQENFLYQQGNEHAISVSTMLALGSSTNVLTENLAAIEDDLKAVMQNKDIISAQVLSLQGDLLASKHSEHQREATQTLFERSLGLLLATSDHPVIELNLPIKVGSHTIGWVKTQFSRETANHNLTTIAMVGLLIAGLFIIAMTMTARQFSRKLTQDIAQLLDMADAAQSGRTFQRIDSKRTDEIGRLARDLYLMLDTINDETNRRQNKESQLKQERDFINTVLDTVGAIILVIDRNGEIVRFNAAAEAFTGYHFNDVQNKPYFWSNFLVPEQRPHVHDLFENIKAGKVRPYFENDWVSRDGNRRLFAWSNTIMRDNQGNMAFLVTIGNDISEHKMHEQELEHIAHHDTLTHLPNRALLMQRLQQQITSAQHTTNTFALVFIDLDGFKAINDTYGHDAGDQLLIAVSARMTRVMKEGDTLARIGGDEFVAIINDLPSEEACTPIIERLLKAASEPVYTPTDCLHVSGSIGVTFFSQTETRDIDTLLHQADQAMYCAKKAGKNGFCRFDECKLGHLDSHKTT